MMAWPAGPRRFRRNQLFPELEHRPDINRGEERLAAEAILASFRGEAVPPAISERAMQTLSRIAL